MRWHFCINTREKKSLDLCHGFMSACDGYGFGNCDGIGYGRGNADGIGDGYVFGIGYNYVLRGHHTAGQGCGYGLSYGDARGNGGSQKEWK